MIRIRVQKKADKLDVNLLNDGEEGEEEEGGLWNTISRLQHNHIYKNFDRNFFFMSCVCAAQTEV